MSHTGRELLLVGAGKMGLAMLKGWLENQVLAAHQIAVLEKHPSDALTALAAESDLLVMTDYDDLTFDDLSTVVLAVKPQIMDRVAPRLSGLVTEQTVFVSIAAGITLATLQNQLGTGARVIRTMPNTPAAIGRGVTAMFAGRQVSMEQSAWAHQLLQAVGEVVVLSNEAQMDAVTAVSGSGPAYVFYLAECLAEAGRRKRV